MGGVLAFGVPPLAEYRAASHTFAFSSEGALCTGPECHTGIHCITSVSVWFLWNSISAVRLAGAATAWYGFAETFSDQIQKKRREDVIN
jgi:hypothetical protein